MPELRPYITMFLQEGYALFPVTIEEASKKIPIPGWSTIPHSAIDADYAGRAYGIQLKDDDLIVDIDSYKDQTLIQKFLKQFGTYNTFITRSGRGGHHIWLKKPSDLRTRKKIETLSGVEFLSKGCYVVGPGSLGASDSHVYRIGYGVLTSRREARPDLLNALKYQFKFDTDGKEILTDAPVDLKRFKQYLNNGAPVAIEGETGDNTTFFVACRGREMGLTAQWTFQLMQKEWNDRCEPPWDADELREKVMNAYKYNMEPAGRNAIENVFPMEKERSCDDCDSGEEKPPELKWDTKGAKIDKTLKNTVNHFLSHKPLQNLLRYNEHSRNIEFIRPAPWPRTPSDGMMWSEHDAVLCKKYLTDNCGFEIATDRIMEAIIVISRMRAYHPIRDYLNSLKWDSIPRLDTWLVDYCGARDDLFIRTVGKLVLVAAVKRIYEPGCQFDFMMVLEGLQGIGKSTLCRIFGKHQWYDELPRDITSKETIQQIQGRWIIEVSEMDTFRKADSNAMKAFLSRQADRMRVPYGRMVENFPRQCIFIGTINPEKGRGYLRDKTGNRRYWPVTVSQVDYASLGRDVDQIWAEATQYYKQNPHCKLYLDDLELQFHQKRITEERMEEDPWEETIKNWIVDRIDDDELPPKITVHTIFTAALNGPGMASIPSGGYQRIKSIMEKLGWEYTTINVAKSDGKMSTTRGFKRPDNLKKVREMIVTI